MTRDGPASYASSNDFRTSKAVDFFAKRQDRQAFLVTADNRCAERPGWLIVEIHSDPPTPIEKTPGCDLAYELVETTQTWGLSGIAWALYRRSDGEPVALKY